MPAVMFHTVLRNNRLEGTFFSLEATVSAEALNQEIFVSMHTGHGRKSRL